MLARFVAIDHYSAGLYQVANSAKCNSDYLTVSGTLRMPLTRSIPASVVQSSLNHRYGTRRQYTLHSRAVTAMFADVQQAWQNPPLPAPEKP